MWTTSQAQATMVDEEGKPRRQPFCVLDFYTVTGHARYFMEPGNGMQLARAIAQACQTLSSGLLVPPKGLVVPPGINGTSRN